MAGIEQFKCPACGGNVEFDAGTQKMKCPYCDAEFDVETVVNNAEDDTTDTADKIVWEEVSDEEWSEEELADMAVYACSSCGGEIVGDENLGATSCPYCGSQVVMTEKFSGALKPDYIIPFKMDKETAKRNYLRNIQANRYAPKSFSSEKHIEEIKGIYVPFWLFDADVDARITYSVLYEERTEYTSYTNVREEKFEMHREGNIEFRNIPVDGSSRIDDDLMESLEPFDFGEAVPFNKAYLAGFLADRYDVNKENSIDRANERIRKGAERIFRTTITGYPSSVEVKASSIVADKCRAKYALYPVWMLSAKYNGKAYTFAMNGQTGKFRGDMPIDNGRLWKYFGKVTLIAGGIMYALGMLALMI